MIELYDESGNVACWFLNQQDYDYFLATGDMSKGWSLDDLLASAG